MEQNNCLTDGRQVRIGVIGVGNIGSAHAAALYRREIKGATLGALCDTDPDKRRALAQSYPDIPVYADASSLFQDGKTDAVIISVPHRQHAPIGTRAFSAGLHVLCEKPAGVSVTDAQALNNAARASGKIFCLMFNQRTNPVFAKAREIVKSGMLGERKRIVWIVTNWYRSQAYYDSGGWRATWSGEGGGVLLNQAPHNLDLLQWIFGMPRRVHAFCYEGKYHNIEVEDDAELHFEYDNGATGTFLTSTGEYPGTNRLEITGDLGKLIIEDDSLRLFRLAEHERDFCYTSREGFPAPPVTLTIPEISGTESSHRGILQNFTNAILTGEPLLCPGEDGIKELSLSNAAYLSAWTGETVSLPIDTARFDSLLALRAASSLPHTEHKEVLGDAYQQRWKVRW